MSFSSAAFTRQQLRLDFATLKTACPKSIYVAPTPDEPLQWSGVLFLRKGPYENAVLRFKIDFPEDFPHRPPVISFLSDVFHPLVTPLTTYTYSTRDTGAETVHAADEQRLPPGGLSLRHGFPEWFEGAPSTSISTTHAPQQNAQNPEETDHISTDEQVTDAASTAPHIHQPPHIVEILQYLRIVFDTEAVLDSIPIEAAANTGAWHAWKSFRAKSLSRMTSPVRQPRDASATRQHDQRSTSPRKQQPGGARRPGEWNWQGVWEDRVRKSVQASVSEPILFGGDGSEVIGFRKMDQDALDKVKPQQTVT